MKLFHLCLSIIIAVFLIGIVVPHASFAKTEVKRIADAPHGGNCVLYARTLVNFTHGKGPNGLETIADKRRVIGSDEPREKRVAVIDVGNNIGHVAVVVDVDKKGKKQRVTLQEANFPPNMPGVQKRKISCKKIKDCEREAKIIGYIKP